jgi:hypothetical protein
LQPAFSQGYIPPSLTTSTTKNDQIANNNNNNNPSPENTIANSSSGQSQLNQEQKPNMNCNSNYMLACGITNSTKTTSNPTTTPTTTSALCASGSLSGIACNSSTPSGRCPPEVESLVGCTLVTLKVN